MSTHQDDLDLLLSLERVLETPPASPSAQHAQEPGYISDDGLPKRTRISDMSAFKDAVKDYLVDESNDARPVPEPNPSKKSNDVELEKFSGLRVRKLLVTATSLNNRFSEVRFIRLPAIRNSLAGDTISGCWATVGVLTEKGNPKLSSTGKNFCVWKMGCLDELSISTFMFGDAYSKNWKEDIGTVFALFNAGVRKDAEGKGFSLSVYSAGQVLKLGTSVDYGICKGKRKDGSSCSMVINKRRGIYCKYHNSKASQKYSTLRSELKGGNLRTAFKDPLRSEGIYLVEPGTDMAKSLKSARPVKVMSVDGLKKALSNANKVTTNSRSQGIRFLAKVTGKTCPEDAIKGLKPQIQQKGSQEKRLSSSMKMASKIVIANQQPETKRMKTHDSSEKLIELDIFSSEEEG